MRSYFFKNQKIKTEKVEIPKIPPKHILIKNRLIGINHSDLYQMRRSADTNNHYFFGCEGVGTVAKSSSVTQRNLKPGDRVGYINVNHNSFSDYVLIREENVFKIYDDIDDVDAASMRKGVTAMMLTYDVYKALQGSWVVINGATGGVADYYIQIASNAGIKVIGLTRTLSQKSHLMSLGCKAVFSWNSPSLVQDVKKITNGVGVNAVIDFYGQAFFQTGVDLLLYFGIYISVGCLESDILCKSELLAEKSLFFTAPQIDHYKSVGPGYILSCLSAQEMISARKIKPHVTEYDMKNLTGALQALDSSDKIGSIVVRL